MRKSRINEKKMNRKREIRKDGKKKCKKYFKHCFYVVAVSGNNPLIDGSAVLLPDLKCVSSCNLCSLCLLLLRIFFIFFIHSFAANQASSLRQYFPLEEHCQARFLLHSLVVDTCSFIMLLGKRVCIWWLNKNTSAGFCLTILTNQR